MQKNDQEIEIKLWLNDISSAAQKLQHLGARQIQPRTLELNLRYDTPERLLTEAGQALRLRKDTEARLTFKGPGVIHEGAHSRREIEFVVADFDAANELLLALGYQVTFIYEKYRAVYQYDDTLIMVDELPFGNFLEIEASQSEKINKMVKTLDLSWAVRINESYIVLFERLKNKLNLPFRDLTFENFSGSHTTIESLGVKPADN